MANDIKISVIIPVYNAEPFLEEAIESVLNQTLSDFELVCVNDGSKDNSLKMLNEFAKKDSRFKIIDQENAGCGAARNRALDEANGQYIYFFDPDDYISPTTFEELYDNAVNNNSDLVIFKIARFKNINDIDYSISGFNLETIFKNQDFNNFTFTYKDVKRYVMNTSFAPWTKLYKKEFLDKYDDFRFPTDIAFDDAPFHIQSMLRASRISFIPKFFYYYRFNPNSIINTSSNGLDIFEICDIVEGFLKRENYYSEFVHEFKLFKIEQILNYLLSTDSEEYFQKAKKEFSDISIDSNDTIREYALNRYYLVLKSDNFNEYKSKEYDLRLDELNKKNIKLKKNLDKIKSKNKKLKKELKHQKELKNKLNSQKDSKLKNKLKGFFK